MRAPCLLFAFIALFLSGCDSSTDSPQANRQPFVKTWVLEHSQSASFSVSGTVRARVESPLAFQVPGRIVLRSVDAGQTLQKGQVLFELDTRDLEQGVQEAQASLAAATAAQRIAQDDLKRHQDLLVHNAVSQQAAEQAELMLREAQARRKMALARLSQARNALEYARLVAPAAGVLTEVTGEAGQVVAPGQVVATLAQSGEREVEVYLPEGQVPPSHGALRVAEQTLQLALREAAGAVDAQSRTLRARYTLPIHAPELQLGSVVRLSFDATSATTGQFVVPIGAISERGDGVHVWVLKAGAVSAVPVSVLGLDTETARVSGPLQAGDVIVALGTHLLNEGMAVKEHQP